MCQSSGCELDPLVKVLPGAQHRSLPPELLRPHIHYPSLFTMILRWPRGSLAKAVRYGTVEDVISDAGQAFTQLGGPERSLRAIDFQIYHQCSGYRKEDAPPYRLKPVPIIIIIIFILQQAFTPSSTHYNQAIDDSLLFLPAPRRVHGNC
jgi:hypothetical protein